LNRDSRARGGSAESELVLLLVSGQGSGNQSYWGSRQHQATRRRRSIEGENIIIGVHGNQVQPDTAANVAGMYAALRNDILFGTSTAANFLHAVRLTRLIDDVMSSARTGTRKSAGDWPLQTVTTKT
jgi:hypothetical protein